MHDTLGTLRCHRCGEHVEISIVSKRVLYADVQRLLSEAAEAIDMLNDDSRRDFPRWEDLARRLREAAE